jgi:hypothetical protein
VCGGPCPGFADNQSQLTHLSKSEQIHIGQRTPFIRYSYLIASPASSNTTTLRLRIVTTTVDVVFQEVFWKCFINKYYHYLLL